MSLLTLITGWPLIIVGVVVTQLLALYFVYVLVADVKAPFSRPIPCSRFLIVTAHPDDETMFFGPFIASEVEQNSELHLLCLSRGNYCGDGETRTQELMAAVDRLGVPSKQVTVLDWPHFADNPKSMWKIGDIREVILDYCCGRPQIEAIVTFDGYGVSGHLNHICVSEAVRGMLDDSQFTQRVFMLESVPLLRKYCRVIEEIWSSKWPSEFRYRLNADQAEKVQWALSAHVTQMVWFRRLYKLFSRYMRVNTFVEVLPVQPRPLSSRLSSL